MLSLPMITSVSRKPTTLNRELMLLFGAPAFFQALVSADRLGLFKCLATQLGQKLDALSRALGLPEISVRTLVMTAQSLGLVIRNGDGGLRNQPWVTASYAGETQELPAELEAYEQLLHRPFGRMEDRSRRDARRTAHPWALPRSSACSTPGCPT